MGIIMTNISSSAGTLGRIAMTGSLYLSSGSTVGPQDRSKGFIVFPHMDAPAVENMGGVPYGALFVGSGSATGTTALYFHDAGGIETNLLAGAANVDISGTPANNQLAIWTDADTLEGDADLLYDGSDLLIGGTAGTTKAMFGDTGTYINQKQNGLLNIVGDLSVQITGSGTTAGTAAVVINGGSDVIIGSGVGNILMSASAGVSIASGQALTLSLLGDGSGTTGLFDVNVGVGGFDLDGAKYNMSSSGDSEILCGNDLIINAQGDSTGELNIDAGTINMDSIGNLTIAGAGGALILGRTGTAVTVAGNLDVNGTTTTIDSANMTIEDSIIGLGFSGSDGTFTSKGDRGILFGNAAKAGDFLPGMAYIPPGAPHHLEQFVLGKFMALPISGAMGAPASMAVPTVVGPLHLLSASSGETISGDGTDLTITSGGKINLTAGTDVHIPAAIGLVFGTGEKIEGDNTNLTITSGGTIILAATGVISAGHHFVPDADNTLDLGAADARWANIYTGDLNLQNDRGDWTLIEESDFLTFRNNQTGRRFRMVMEDITGMGNYGPGNDGEM